MVLRLQRLERVGSQPNVAQRRVPFLCESRQPPDRRPVELRAAGACVAGDECGRVDQAELPMTSRSSEVSASQI
jgi:hypothetical protein